ncbi:MAG: YIP1 family protein [Blastocatellia bacterium]
MNSEVSYANQSAPQADPPPIPQGFFNRLIGVYFSPSEAFKEIGLAPTVLAPLLVLALASAIGAWVMVERVGVEKFTSPGVEKALADGQISQEQADQRLEQMRQFAPYIKASFPAIGFVMSIIMVLALAGVAKLVSMMFGVENEFKPLMAVTAYSLLAVGLLGMVVMTIVLYLKPVEEIDITNLVGSNAAALIGMAGVKLPKFVQFLLAYVDVFYIWKVILLGIGGAAVSKRVKTSTGITYAAMVGVVFAILGAAWGAIFG